MLSFVLKFYNHFSIIAIFIENGINFTETMTTDIQHQCSPLKYIKGDNIG